MALKNETSPFAAGSIFGFFWINHKKMFDTKALI